MNEAEPKTLIEFSLLPEGKAEVQHFFDERFGDLRHTGERKESAKAGLKEVLEKVLPTEAKRMLGDVLQGNSDCALLIHNFPEREEFLNAKPIPVELHTPKNVYTYHIGNALYDMAGARHVGIEKLKRMRNRGTASQVVGPEIHRDVPFRPGVSGDESPCVEYVMFSCPHNAENAVTEVINVKKAIESIAPEMREKTEVRVETMDLNRKGGNVVRCNLNQALAVLSNPIESLDNFREISLLADPVGAEGKAFNEAIAKHGALVNLQPGDMLVLNQHKIFHRAHSGHPEMIAHPHMLSRLLFANSGVAAR